jgi:arylsulfatase A-like enzyme
MPRAAGLSRIPSPAAARPGMEAHRERLLPEVMRRAGYATAAVSANFWLSRGSGFDIGFDDFTQVDSDRNGQLHAASRRERTRWWAEAVAGQVDDGAAEVERTLERQLSAQRKPFFWFVNLMECHSPYLPPRPYGNVSRLDRLRAAEDARRHYTLEGIWRACSGVTQVPQEALERLRGLYRASIRYMDDWIARLLERLDRAGVFDETLVIVTSDHGENFGEGGLISHGLSLDQRLIGVPFVVSKPGVEPIASLADLPRLVAGHVGLEEHPWHDGPPAGVGVAQFDPPTGPDDEAGNRYLTQIGLGGVLDEITRPLTCAVSGGLKLVRRGDREELFDLAADPLELSPLAEPDFLARGEGRTAALAELRGALNHPAVAATGEPAGGGPAPPPVSDAERRELEERMKLLGYM